MEFCKEKVHATSLNAEFQKQILSIALRVQEAVFLKQRFIDELIDIKIEEKEVTLEKKIKFEKVLNNHLELFLICEQLFKKFGHEIFFLKNDTLKFAIIYERIKAENFIKDLEKKEAIDSQITVISKTFV